MGVPLLLLILAGVAVALLVPGHDALLLLAGPGALAALILWLRAALARRRPAPDWILIDGSNVMHWRDNTPQVDTLREVMARALGLPEARVPVVPKGTIADAYLLTVARDYSAPV